MPTPRQYRDDVHAPGDDTRVEVGAWYVDRSPSHEYTDNGLRFCVRSLGDRTVRVVNEHGDVQTFNAQIFTAQMRLEVAKPKRKRLA